MENRSKKPKARPRSPKRRQEMPLAEARRIILRELACDVGSGDVTSALVVPAGRRMKARLVSRGEAVLCGVDFFAETFRLVSKSVRCRVLRRDGSRLGPGAAACEVSGPARAILAGERTALNIVCHLSGIATLTAQFVRAVRGTRAVILDTRKTLPGLRELEKYAVRTGGGSNHRFGLHDMVLIKDNHVAASGRSPAALARRAAARTKLTVEVEVEGDTPGAVEKVLGSGADIILLDNFSTSGLTWAVEIAEEFAKRTGGRPLLEASGGVSLDTVRAVALSGVDRISIGALTHSAPAADFALDYAR